MERKTHCQDVHICMVGANRFQNDLFVSSMKEILHCQCRFTEIGSCLELPQVHWNQMVEKNLVYLDCFDLRCADAEVLLLSVNQNIPCGTPLALYNCPENAAYEKQALVLGARGFFHSDDTPCEFCRGTKVILKGEIWISRKKLGKFLLTSLAEASGHRPCGCTSSVKLTPREKDILRVLSTGGRNRDIAAELHISIHTVRTHLYNICRKLKVKNRMQASLWGQENL